MLELIFQGFLEWAYGLVLECWQYFSSALLDIMSMDLAYLKTHVPIIDDMMQILMAVGWALLLGNLVFQAIKSMASGLGFEGEDPKLLFARTFVFAFLLLASPQICEIGLNMTSRVIDLLQVPDAVNVQSVDKSIFGAMSVSWLLVIIFGVIVMFKVFKLLLEIAERYVILAMLTITAPLAFSMGGSKSTSEIFTGWCRMFGSMCLLMVTNVVFFKMLLSVLSAIPSGIDVLPWMVLILTIVKVARKADSIVTRIGLNPAITGDSLGGRPGALTYMVVRTAASQITKAIGKSNGDSGKGRTSGAPPTGPRTGGPSGGAQSNRPSGASSYAQQSASQQTTAQQNTAQQSGSQNSTTHQSSNVQGDRQQVTAQEYTAGSTYQNNSQMGQTASKSAQSRKSSVPAGTRRAPTHVKTGAATPGGTQARAGIPGAAGKAGVAMSENTLVTSQPKGAGMVSERAASRGSTHSAAQPGSAGKRAAPASSRLTQINSQRVQGGPVNGTTQAAERTGITVGQTVRTSAPASAQKSAPVVNIGAATSPGENGQRSQIRSTGTRYSQRPPQTSQPTPKTAPTKQAASATHQTTTHTDNIQHGIVNKGSAPVQQPAHEPRSGRNKTTTGAAAPADAKQHSPVRQEQRSASARITPLVKGTAPGLHPDPAGTTGNHQVSQTRQTARPTAHVPTAKDTQSGKKAVSSTTAALEGNIKRNGTEAPSRKQQGKKHE